jgi:hypothetical protein
MTRDENKTKVQDLDLAFETPSPPVATHAIVAPWLKKRTRKGELEITKGKRAE